MNHKSMPAGFARLLATENITVRLDPNAPTAMFDVEHRVLTMPNWQCSENLRDMLIGHEVAHALFTTGDILDMCDRVGADRAVAKDYLNVCEDVRIDRLIQRRYAGLRRDYAVGYREMIEKDFFGVGDSDPNEMPLIDRINCHFKHFDGIRFTAEEQVFVDRLDRIETIDEMIEVARDLYNYAAEQTKTEREEQDQQSMAAAGGEGEDEDGPEAEASAGTDGDGGDEGDADAAGDEGEGAEGSGEANTNGDEPTSDDVDADGGSGLQASKSDAPARATTLDRMNRAISETVDNSGRISNYRLPKANLDNIIYSFDRILAHTDHGPVSHFDEFSRNARGTVNNLAMLFERKKAAAVARRTQVAKTGRLDMTVLHKYKMTEDIFLRNRVEAKGKNHGMVMYVDWSGSMCDCITETVQQMLVLAMFCRKANIPFRVYGFTTWRPAAAASFDHAHDGNTGFEYFSIGNFTLLELFSDRMKTTDFARMANLLLRCTDGDNSMYHGVPQCLRLTGTPLNEAIVAGVDIAKRFRADYRLDVLNTIFLTDGVGGNPFYGGRDYVLNDPKTGKVWTGRYGDTNTLLRIYRELVGGNLIGFFLDSKRSITREVEYRKDIPNGTEFFKKNRFVQVPHKGYDTYYLMDKNTAVYTGSEKMDELPENASVTKAINAFKKDLGSRNASRPLLNDFSDRIARESV